MLYSFDDELKQIGCKIFTLVKEQNSSVQLIFLEKDCGVLSECADIVMLFKTNRLQVLAMRSA